MLDVKSICEGSPFYNIMLTVHFACQYVADLLPSLFGTNRISKTNRIAVVKIACYGLLDFLWIIFCIAKMCIRLEMVISLKMTYLFTHTQTRYIHVDTHNTLLWPVVTYFNFLPIQTIQFTVSCTANDVNIFFGAVLFSESRWNSKRSTVWWACLNIG